VVRPTPPPRRPVPRDLIGRCFNCLRTDHVVAACTHLVYCLRCHGEGHQVHTCKRPRSPDLASPPPRSRRGIETTTASLSPTEGTLLPGAPTRRPRLQTCDPRTAAMDTTEEDLSNALAMIIAGMTTAVSVVDIQCLLARLFQSIQWFIGILPAATDDDSGPTPSNQPSNRASQVASTPTRYLRSILCCLLAGLLLSVGSLYHLMDGSDACGGAATLPSSSRWCPYDG
jgi:hypothetical protein